MDNRTQIEDVAERVDDMVNSAAAIKGVPFAAAVGAFFALDGLRDLGRRLLDAMPDVAEPYTKTLDILHRNVEIYILGSMPEAEREEARGLSRKMFDNQRALHDSMRRA